MVKILIVAICYNNEQEVIEYARMISKQSASDLISLTIVVNQQDDNMKDIFLDVIKKVPLNIRVVYPTNNIGYLNGAIYGYNDYIKSASNKPEWLVISNTDIIIRDPRFFEKFLNSLYDKDVWCIGPSIYSPSKKSYDNPHYFQRCSIHSIDRLIRIFNRPLLTYLYFGMASIKSGLVRIKKEPSQYVYSNHGSFFFIRDDLAMIIKDEFYKPIMYSEEAFIAEIILQNEKKEYYDSSIELIHNESSVTGLLSIKNKSKYIADSLRYIRDRFYN